MSLIIFIIALLDVDLNILLPNGGTRDGKIFCLNIALVSNYSLLIISYIG